MNNHSLNDSYRDTKNHSLNDGYQDTRITVSERNSFFLKIENNSRWQYMESALQGDNHYCYKMSGNKCGSI